MLFGLSHALAGFQSYIMKFLIEKLDIFIIVYFYNISIYIIKANYICLISLETASKIFIVYQSKEVLFLY